MAESNGRSPLIVRIRLLIANAIASAFVLVRRSLVNGFFLNVASKSLYILVGIFNYLDDAINQKIRRNSREAITLLRREFSRFRVLVTGSEPSPQSEYFVISRKLSIHETNTKRPDASVLFDAASMVRHWLEFLPSRYEICNHVDLPLYSRINCLNAGSIRWISIAAS